MFKIKSCQVLITVCCTIFIHACSAENVTGRQPDSNKISRFGEYSGYSKRSYDSYVRESKYVTVRDGTRLAVDIYRPAVAGKAAKGPFPTLVTNTRYWRAIEAQDGTLTQFIAFEMDDRNSQRRYLLEHGYNIVIFDARGTGASFGQALDPFDLVTFRVSSGKDTHDVIEWAAKQAGRKK